MKLQGYLLAKQAFSTKYCSKCKPLTSNFIFLVKSGSINIQNGRKGTTYFYLDKGFTALVKFIQSYFVLVLGWERSEIS